MRHIDQDMPFKTWNEEVLDKAVAMEHEKAKTLKDIPGLIDIFFVDKVEYLPEAVEKVFKAQTAKDVLIKACEKLTVQRISRPKRLKRSQGRRRPKWA